MRAIRTVVDATYLVSDDPMMVYTMFVAALESLSQLVEFPDDHDWSRYDSKKAKIIDAALDGLTDEQADPIRDAVLTIDQLSVGRRFTAFTLDHVRPSFYREEAVNARQPIRAVDLPKAVALNNSSPNVHSASRQAAWWYSLIRPPRTYSVTTCLSCRSWKISIRSRHSRRMVLTHRSA